jgi:hypothetical protein
MGISIAGIGTDARHAARPLPRRARPQEYAMKYAMKTTHPNQPEQPREGAPDPERDDEARAVRGERKAARRWRNASKSGKPVEPFTDDERPQRHPQRIARQAAAGGDDESAWYSFRRL